MSNVANKRIINMPTIEESRQIVSAAKADPDAQPMTLTQLNALVPIAAVRGRPKSAHKKLLLSVRYSVEVIDFFRASGDGWQSKMDDVLCQYVSKQMQRREVA